MNQTGHKRDMEARNMACDTANVQVTTSAPKPDFHGSLVWRCTVPDCGETMQFTQEDGDVIAFLIVHHLVRKHGLSRRDVLAYDPGLEAGTAEYVGFPEETRR